MKKRILALLLALCMAASLLPMAALAAQTFSDVRSDDWFADDVAYASENGLMQGVGDGKFAPDATTTRAMIVTVLHRSAGEPAATKAAAFRDVASDAWYAAAVNWAAEQGIVNGKSADSFAPDDAITREQFAAILYRYAAKTGMDVSGKADLSGFSDVNAISDYAKNALAWANAAGLINGVSATALDPAGNATRAQAAAILHRFDTMKNASKPGEITFTVDKKDKTVTEPRQTFAGTYTVTNDQIDRIDWVHINESMVSGGSFGTAMIDQTYGTWKTDAIQLGTGLNTVKFTAYSKNGATAEQVVTIVYDAGNVADYSEDDITYFADEHGNVTEFGFVNDVILVVLDAEYSQEEQTAAIEAVCKTVNGSVIGQLNGLELYQIRVARGDYDSLRTLCETAEAASDVVASATLDMVAPSSGNPDELITSPELDGDEAFAFSVPDQSPVYGNDPWNNASWDESDPDGANWWAEAIYAPSAWGYQDYFQTVKVGIIDSGAYLSHEDLNVTKVSSGYSAASHGTHVAGLIGATPNNGKGLSGVCWTADMYAYDVYSNNTNSTPTTTRYTNAVNALLAKGCKVLNNSNGYGAKTYSELSSLGSTVDDEVSTWNNIVTNGAKNYHDFIVCQCAGNGYDTTLTYSSSYEKPFDAWYNGLFACVSSSAAKQHVIVVAASQPLWTNDSDQENYQLVNWSNIGTTVDVAAPGRSIYSTYYATSGDYAGEKYLYMSGTSMATPITAGLTAMVWSVNPDFTSSEVKEIVVESATTVCYRNEQNTKSSAIGYDSRETYPMVNAEAAVEEALKRTYGDGTLAVSFVNAANNEPVNNVSYEIRLGSPTGTVVASGTANGSANITLPRAQGTDYHQAQYYLVATGNFTAYTSTAFTIDVGGTTSLTAALNVPEAPQAQSYRIVLTWNAEPADLDAHLVAGSGGHVYYKNRSIEGASMDLDDTQSYGPETMTVTDVSALGGFTYSVHDFTNRATFSDAAGLKGSGATVRVYTGSTLVKTYTVPENMYGTVWNVFSVDAEGNITDGGGFAYSGNGAAIAVLFPAQQSGATPAALPSETVWRKVDPKKQ